LAAAAVTLIGLPSELAARGLQSGNATTFSGQATVIKGTLAGVTLPNVADTGPLDPLGGARENSLVCYPDGPNCQVGLPDLTNGMLSATVLHASTVGRGERSRSKATVAELSLTVAGQSIQVALIRAVAQAVCNAGVAAVAGGSELVDLMINNLPVVVTGIPGQDVSVGPVSILLNEQTSSTNGGTGDITVNAIHVRVKEVRDPFTNMVTVPGTDLIVAQAHADITCGQRDCNFAQKVTGGGFVVLSSGAKANFAVAGKNGSDWGHFLVINHQTGDKLKATTHTTSFDAAGFAAITGTAQVNGVSGYQFTVRVKDNGEPGRGSDQFELASTYASMNIPLTTLGGGNIQFHIPCKNP
jgi:hypothetical protein